jgi:anti-sigma factor RsiW
MDATHPSDTELLEYLEGELDEETAEAVHTHVASCETCAREVADAERAATVLRASSPLWLPDGRLGEMVARLPSQEGGHGELRSFMRSRKRLVAVLAPAAAAVTAVVIAFAVTGGDDSPEQEASAPATAAETAAGEGEESLDAAAAAQGAPVATVQGPPRAIVRILRESGFTARRDSGTVIVTGATPAQVRQALANREQGPVPVFVVP